jgi:hypothetical protein
MGENHFRKRRGPAGQGEQRNTNHPNALHRISDKVHAIRFPPHPEAPEAGVFPS